MQRLSWILFLGVCSLAAAAAINGADPAIPPETVDFNPIGTAADSAANPISGPVAAETSDGGAAPAEAAETTGAGDQLRRPQVPVTDPHNRLTNPIDRFLQPYFDKRGIQSGPKVDNVVFARRACLDLTGMLPTAGQIAELAGNGNPELRDRFVRRLLDDREAYASHWLTFWNDALRNAYQGTGFIDGGRKQITGWLFESLYNNKPYDQFVRELINPVDGSEGFVKAIKWRGVVNASQRPELQAAQNISQVFMGTNLKCASCHDSFIDDWKLEDAYALANVFAEAPLETNHCDKPIGEFVEPRFIFGSGGTIDSEAGRQTRMQQLAELLVRPENGRFARTIVNRLWAVLMGRGLVEPVDEMDNEPWHADLLDWLAADLVDHGFDLKHTLYRIATSQAYQRASVGVPKPGEDPVDFRGPHVKRMTAEQLVDAVALVADVWPEAAEAMEKIDGRGQGGQLAEFRRVLHPDSSASPQDAGTPERIRASWLVADPLVRGLGRPNREQVVTRRDSWATMLQALELTNGETLASLLARGARRWIERSGNDSASLVVGVYRAALSREPTRDELATAQELLGAPPTQNGVEDLLWSVLMLPEFQLIY